MSFIPEIERVKAEYGLSNNKLAKRVGVNFTMISRLLKGERHPTLAFLSLWLAAFPESDETVHNYVKEGK
jgi:predicted transcriptional regulator